MKKSILPLLAAGLMIFSDNSSTAQCASGNNIYSFVYNSKTYEVVRENKTWVNASACAVERGGYLAEINDVAEQNAVFTELNNNASIITSNTLAPDGGNASYVWIGGNDIQAEGVWVWDGNDDNVGPQFWQGLANGSPVGGLYNNWGNEPDDFGIAGQDGLGLALTNWPLGTAAQWNDVNDGNTLYFVIEYATIVGVENKAFDESIQLYPNPFTDGFSINNKALLLDRVIISNTLGQVVKTIQLQTATQQIDLAGMAAGTYLVKVVAKDGQATIKKMLKH